MQIFAYYLYWDAKRSMLLYPNSEGMKETFGNYHIGREENLLKNNIVYFMTELNCKKQVLQMFWIIQIN